MKISGDVEIIRFVNESNGYTVAVIDYQGEPVVAAGAFPPLKEGMRVVMEGDFIVHPKFGRQFKATSVSYDVPKSEDGMIRYLGSGILKGVGPKTALSIVSKFQDKTFDVMEHAPLRLAEIRGITAEKAQQIGEQFAKLKNMNEAMLFLQSNLITLNLSMKIYAAYGDKTIGVVKNNPYRLIEDIDGVGFVRADEIARKLGFEKDGVPRLRAGLIHTLKESAEKNGNTYLPLDELTQNCLELLQASNVDALGAVIDDLIIEGFVKRVSLPDCDNAIMLRKLYRAEKSVAVALSRLKERENAICDDVGADIEAFEKFNGVKLAQRQREAVELAANSGVCVITGGPGTGKTTIIKCILDIFSRRKEKVLLMAPTGRAAKRLSESTSKEASTIHRALAANLSPDSEGDVSAQPLTADVVIVDEVSMMDVFLTDLLLKRLGSNTKVIFVGDKNQLPSVGAGNVLSDILACEQIASVTLDAIFRQGDQSLIVVNAHRINAGEMPFLDSVDKDFFFQSCEDPQTAAAVVVDMAARRIPKYLNCEPHSVQVLCPVKNGACGTVAVNRLMQDSVNPFCGGGEITDEGIIYRVGDKVMHIANNYQLEWKNYKNGYETGKGVFNGDLGLITDIRKDSGEIDVRFEDGRETTYSYELRSQLIPAYAITVHKSQGSEFDAVIIPVVSGAPMIMTRNLLYTAITRAKKMAVIVGSAYWVKRMVDNNYIQKRYSALKDFIIEAIDESSLLHSLKG